MDEFLEGMSEAIGDFFINYFSSLDSIMKLAEAAPMDKIDGFPSKALWEASQGISSSIGVGVATVIIALFLFFELAAVFNRSDAKGWDGIYWILMAFLKVAVAITICKNMTLIIQICFAITSEIVNGLKQSGLLKLQKIENQTLAQDLVEYYADKGWWQSLCGWFFGLIASFVNNIAMTIVEIICKLRFIEIYVFTAIAPLPFCTFCNQEYKHIGIAFLKRLLALGLQGVFIAIVCIFYVQIVNASIGNSLNVTGNPTGAMCSMMGYSLLLLIAVFQTGGWSKSLLQVN